MSTIKRGKRKTKKKTIGLLSYEKTNYPNLVLMKLAAYHKQKGDTVKWWTGPLTKDKFDVIYGSKVFTWTKTKTKDMFLENSNLEIGGTGFVGNKNELSDEIEHICPDYSIYPNIDASYGFLTRGCPNKCPWCFVPEKEGKIRKNADVEEFLKHKKVVLMDNNVLSHDWGIQQIEKLIKLGVKVDFNQGLDARLIDNSMAKLLSKIRWDPKIRLACDTDTSIEPVRKATELLRWHNTAPLGFFVYVLVKDIESSIERIKFLKGMNLTPFAQPYRDKKGTPPKKILKDFARWVNRHQIFFSCTWDEYKQKKGCRL
jgi:hypothetical protein